MIGIHRLGGLTEPLLVDMNGKQVAVDTGDSDEFTEFFAPLHAVVPPTILRESNRVEIKAQKGTTIASVQLITHRSL